MNRQTVAIVYRPNPYGMSRSAEMFREVLNMARYSVTCVEELPGGSGWRFR